ASWYLAYGLTPPLRATNNTPGSLVRLTARTLSENDDLTANVFYINQFGRLPVVGDYVFVKYRLADQNSYAVTAPTLIKVEIEAA
ncbi:MAG: hypothetical protein WC297_03520, partial [Candidatus Paceibacterota bacterium]